jgi:uncharacterized protein
MESSLTERLCTNCALCCDGSLFADVELSGPSEAGRLEILGIEIEDDDPPLLVQPCRALSGKRCTIYPHRPKCCRTFECRLLRDVRRGDLGVEQAEAHIAEALAGIAGANALIVQLGVRASTLPLKERSAEALSLAAHANPERHAIQARLEASMSAIETLIDRHFLGGEEA